MACGARRPPALTSSTSRRRRRPLTPPQPNTARRAQSLDLLAEADAICAATGAKPKAVRASLRTMVYVLAGAAKHVLSPAALKEDLAALGACVGGARGWRVAAVAVAVGLRRGGSAAAQAPRGPCRWGFIAIYSSIFRALGALVSACPHALARSRCPLPLTLSQLCIHPPPTHPPTPPAQASTLSVQRC